MGLPLDDSYIYLTYAKQFGRAQPFTYFPGGGYSAGSTSVLWPMLLAPFWTLGARGHALVWVSFGMCAALYAAVARRRATGSCATIAGERRRPRRRGARARDRAVRVVRAVGHGGRVRERAARRDAAAARATHRATAPPSRLLVACLAATSLSRPEAMLIVVGDRRRRVRVQRVRRALARRAWWLAPLVAPVAWLVANALLAGNFFPNTGVAKSHFYLPGLRLDVLARGRGRRSRRACCAACSGTATSPLVWPRVVAVLCSSARCASRCGRGASSAGSSARS